MKHRFLQTALCSTCNINFSQVDLQGDPSQGMS